MSTAPQPAKELTMRELAVQAATTAKLNSFPSTYDANPAQAARVVAGFAKTNSPLIRMTNMCDTNLAKQLVFIKLANYKVSILTCPFVTMNAEGKEVIAGSIGDAIDVICPTTIGMRDARGDVLSICTSRIRADELKLPTSAANPLDEDGPPPPEGDATAVEFAAPAGPDRINLVIEDANHQQCIVASPKTFPLTKNDSPVLNSPPISIATSVLLVLTEPVDSLANFW